MDDSAADHKGFFTSWVQMKQTNVYLVIIIKKMFCFIKTKTIKENMSERRLKWESWEIPRLEEQKMRASS